jgi:hypothetical protein
MAREIWRRQPATRLRPRVVPPTVTGPFALTPGPLLWLTRLGERAVLGLGDRVLDMPVEACGLLSELLAGVTPLEPGSAGLDAASRDVVVRRLVAEGVLASVES